MLRKFDEGSIWCSRAVNFPWLGPIFDHVFLSLLTGVMLRPVMMAIRELKLARLMQSRATSIQNSMARTLRLLLFLVAAAEATEAGTTAEAFAFMICVA